MSVTPLLRALPLAVWVSGCADIDSAATRVADSERTSSGAAVAASSAATIGASGGRRRPPLGVDLVAPEHVIAGQAFDLSVRVELSPLVTGPVDLVWLLPPGVTRTGGTVAERIETPRRLISRTLTLVTDSIPEQDVVVEVGSRGRGYGAHARVSYRFGRPEPLLAAPARGRATTVNGVQLGSAIPLK